MAYHNSILISTDLDPTNQEGSLSDISPELLQFVLSLVFNEKYKLYGISESIYKKFLLQFTHDFPRDRCPLVLAPLIYNDNTDIQADTMAANSQPLLTSSVMDTSWGNLVVDIGMYTNNFRLNTIAITSNRMTHHLILSSLHLNIICRLCIYCQCRRVQNSSGQIQWSRHNRTRCSQNHFVDVSHAQESVRFEHQPA